MFANGRYADRRRIRELEQVFPQQEFGHNGLLESQFLAHEGDTMTRVGCREMSDVAVVLVLHRKGQARSGDDESQRQRDAQ
jgi:hypothetical protein